jgi:hypothetical protein
MNDMASIRELITALLAQRLLIRHDGDKVQVVAPLGDPIPAEIVSELRERKDELLAYLSWREAADDLLAATMQRLSDSYPIGARLDGPAWHEADATLTAAYWSFDLGQLGAALRIYERFAVSEFAQARANQER